MTTAPDVVAQILRLHAVEKWRVGAIARQLHVHRDAVRRVLGGNCAPVHTSPLRPSRIDPYRPFILATLEKFPTLTAARLHAMVAERGYIGASSHFRFLVAGMRPVRAPRLTGACARCLLSRRRSDWGHFGHLRIGRARRALMAFVMVLSHSRMVFMRFFLDARMDSFLRGHALAFMALGGVPRALLYDNLKSAVVERVGDAIRFNPTLLALAGYCRFEPCPVAPARGNGKGRGERAIRYIRDSFFAGRTFSDLDDLNAQARAWCLGRAADRRWHEGGTLSVRQAFQAEALKLPALPAHEFALGERVAVSMGKTRYVRFDLNDYSVPHTHVRCTLAVLADEHPVRILEGAIGSARHDRCWDRGQQIEIPAHATQLLERTALAEGIHAMANKPVLHGDNGATLKATTVLAMLYWLGVKASYSRPRVSDDNAFVESVFRTAKYRPEFPEHGFADLDAARAWATGFVHWYNLKHRHSGIRYVTPAQRHAGQDREILRARHQVYAQARQNNPRRWSGATRNWSHIATVTLNPERTEVVTAAVTRANSRPLAA
jgi:transposase